jgi:hypothetical protein
LCPRRTLHTPSREGDDGGDKRRDFQSLASLEAYVIAVQDARCVKIYRRTERGEWRDPPDVHRDGERFELPRLTRRDAPGDWNRGHRPSPNRFLDDGESGLLEVE